VAVLGAVEAISIAAMAAIRRMVASGLRNTHEGEHRRRRRLKRLYEIRLRVINKNGKKLLLTFSLCLNCD
jgi:hypothetical protein